MRVTDHVSSESRSNFHRSWGVFWSKRQLEAGCHALAPSASLRAEHALLNTNRMGFLHEPLRSSSLRDQWLQWKLEDCCCGHDALKLSFHKNLDTQSVVRALLQGSKKGHQALNIGRVGIVFKGSPLKGRSWAVACGRQTPKTL